MTLQANSRHRLIFRIALIVTYFGFFATQLSYKFYFLASYPYYTSGAPTAKGQNIGQLMPGAKNIFALSLDKRYDGKHLFPHPEPVFRINPPLPAPHEYAATRPVSIPRLFPCTPTQRGPPSMV